ncbi:hypothetical protein MNBD_GAMMA22-2497 [hydrothermal vent metagenome]|uniref:Uncharacterized protein n=1 Tax=hydrothermal vent metagenome TaxID=652676 RepID=A0A3B0ZXY7_9ZZZZ
MSNIAGKAYAMNVITPIKWYMAWVNRIIFWAAQLPFLSGYLKGLITLSLIHYARWVIVKPSEFPRLDSTQPEETIKYTYMFFFSNFNGSWEQYVDSFHTSIPDGLNLFWYRNVKYPGSVPLQGFYSYITYNQIWTNHYYSAYPMATSNDIKSSKKIKSSLINFYKKTTANCASDFYEQYQKLLLTLQNDISLMEPSPIVSLSAQAVSNREHQLSQQQI